MQGGYEDIKTAGAGELILISSDNQNATANTKQKYNITYLLLSDGNANTISDYNSFNTGNRGIARPVTYIINENGKIADKFLDGIYDRTESANIIEALNNL